MTGIPDDFDEMRRKKVSEKTIKNPAEKLRDIEELMKGKLSKESDLKELSELGLDISRQLTTFKAKVAPMPKLQLGKNKSIQQGKEANFQLFAEPIFQSKHGVTCGIVCFRGVDLKQLQEVFNNTSKKLEADLKLLVFEADKKDMREMQSQISKAISRDCNICLIVLPSFWKHEYKKIKTFTVGEKEIATQVMLDSAFRKKNAQSIFTKILLQILAKRGNILWVPSSPHKVDQCMLGAFDTAKATRKTALSCCATINSTFSSVHSQVKLFDDPDNKFNEMVGLVLGSLKAYMTRNSSLPKEVIYFLNACASSQLPIYSERLFQPLMQRVQEIYGSHHPENMGVSFVMINLKNSERFFEKRQDRVENVKAGLLVSDTLVSEDYDFFLVSQKSNRGTTVPNHYKVVFTTSKLEEAKLQSLIFAQCFNYVNWTGSIKVPGVLQYAKKCAKFAAEVLEQTKVPSALEGKLYYV